MARTRKTETAPKTRRGRKAQTASAETAVIVSAEEQALTQKYPTVQVVPGSWMASGGRPDTHGKTATVLTLCPCGEKTARATSDLWIVGSHCPQCRKQVIKNRKDKAKQAK